MKQPLVSVIVPAYKQAAFLGEAIRSVLGQSYTELELIVVDDCSPDNTAGVVQSFADARLRYIRHEYNRMLPAARNTGLRAARGEVIALLDADDLFAPDKLAEHVAFLERNPEVGVSYNNRYDLECRSNTVRNIVRPPSSVTLADLVLGFPFSPSDMVLRRHWALAVELFDESFVHFSEDLDINCRLALAGCRFGGVDRCLNYRRHHAGRTIHNVRQRLHAALRALQRTFDDARTPPEVQALRGQAYANHYVVWGVEALRQGDAATGIELLAAAVESLPSLLAGHPNELTTYLVHEAVHDEAEDHGAVYRSLVDPLPPAFAPVIAEASWGIGRGWLVKAQRALLWGDPQEGRRCIEEAQRVGAVVDKAYVDQVVHQLLCLEIENGTAAADDSARRIDAQWQAAAAAPAAPSFAAALELGRVFEYDRTGRYADVPAQVRRALRSNPRHALNRGLLSLWLRAARSAQLARPAQHIAA